eukprot:TRINITY_DN44810_c1_g1_i1.p1 TRINITY_DN44810_c1_g1~~TRINITY_DN44810_c1_g1_i1.p1  ORF type:complete len:702 (-),score=192.04 TRINITY_DN44810_c1_g1_i1:379-2484(-)
MADLIRTQDVDALSDGEEASEEDAAPTMGAGKKKSSVGFFSDLMSDEDDAPPKGDARAGSKAGWDFASLPSAADSDGLVTTGLKSKIKERLESRKEAGEADDAESGPATKKGKKAKAGAAGTAEHLRTEVHFADLRISRPLLRAVADLGFDTPTPIQRDVIPPALQGLDVLATAETGSGKTASFLLPALERLCQSASVRARRRDASGRVLTGNVATKAMVLIPTRELAVQCHAMLKNLSKYTMVTSRLVSGGYDQSEQAQSLRQQPDIVVATPGRILDHLLNSQSVHMEMLEIIIFDEADRLLELGFRDECHEVLKRCAKGRQTMLFSATMNTSVEDLAALALIKPVRVHASPVNRVAQTLEQEFVKTPTEQLREAVVLSLCTRNYLSKVIVFCATKEATHRLAIIFGLAGLNFAELHGNLPQYDRIKALTEFQQQEVDFLLATDIAARGLDLENVETVINYHLPVDITRYIHRVGRTARMGRAGRAVTIYSEREYAKVKALGRQCCSKVKSKVLKRTVAADTVRSWKDKIEGFEDDIKLILEEESVDREMRLADILANRSTNIEKHKAEIHSRPEREWIMTNREKRKLRDDDKARVKKLSDSAADADAPEVTNEEAGDGKTGKGGGKGKGKAKRVIDKKAQRTMDRIKAEKDAQKKEKMDSQRAVRASARRQRKASKGGDGNQANGPGGNKKKKKKKGGR